MRIRLVVNVKAHAVLFHRKILSPSSLPEGMRLKRAIHALNTLPRMRAVIRKGNATIRSIVDRIMFVNGPAMDILPMLFLFTYPATITAPGDIILNGKIIEINVKIAPVETSLNSAQKPILCAAIL